MFPFLFIFVLFRVEIVVMLAVFLIIIIFEALEPLNNNNGEPLKIATPFREPVSTLSLYQQMGLLPSSI